MKDKLLHGYQAGKATFEVHLDGYDQSDLLAGKGPSKRREFFYFSDDGDPELAAVWTDLDFDPSLRAFYYARAIEIPTPRWTAYDAARFGITMPPEVPMEHQERAWTSPIWYTP